MFWQPGEVVAWREAWRGERYCAIPVRVIEDGPEATVLYLAEGTRFEFVPGAWQWSDQHPWEERGEWTGHGVLISHRAGAAHTVWHFWHGDERSFVGWYVNMQEPLRRGPDGFETQDQELDIVVLPDGSWTWKDEQELLDWVPRGRFTEEEVAVVREEGERVLAEWPFPTGWENWRPDPAWTVPELADA
jgi:hypothetical protein